MTESTFPPGPSAGRLDEGPARAKVLTLWYRDCRTIVIGLLPRCLTPQDSRRVKQGPVRPEPSFYEVTLRGSPFTLAGAAPDQCLDLLVGDPGARVGLPSLDPLS